MSLMDVIQANMAKATLLGLSQQTAEDDAIDGRIVTLRGQSLINFASCSYLGLELDERVKAGAKDAIDRYGAFFSSSRAYLRSPLYRELEERLSTLFDAHVLVTPSTTLGHLSALPVLIGQHDTLLLDRQVHASVQMTAQCVAANGAKVGFVEHNDMDALEARLIEHGGKQGRVFYAADGVYSMYGDAAPLARLAELVERYEHFVLYVDDAHGMSWRGTRGMGYAKSQLPAHPRVIVAVSLAKAFGTGGGALIFHDAKLRERVQCCGGPQIFSGQLPPAVLGAAIASADIHLSPQMPLLQAELAERITLARTCLIDHGITPVAAFEGPILFVGTIKFDAALEVAKRVQADGFWVNVAGFPATPRNGAGLRVTLSRHVTLSDVFALTDSIAHHVPIVLDQFKLTTKRVSEAPAYRRVSSWPLAA